jgi:hypothetical protein
MPTSKDLRSYPAELHAIAEGFRLGERRIEIPCASPSEAVKLRFKFYTFRKAVLAAQADELYENINAIQVKLEGSLCIFIHCDDDPAMQAIRAVLSKHRALASPPADPSLGSPPSERDHAEDSIEQFLRQGDPKSEDKK